ncbi:MAG TPA: hypothetical protein VGC96_13090 [Candidatus Elarobacter sp.]|jgi:hypothetical protein
MRFSAVVVAFATVLLASAASLASAAPPASLDVTAKAVTFYSNRFIVTADGDVRVRLSDGTVIAGETFTMDLKLNRYLVAGDVHVDGPTIHQLGAAFAGYPDLDRSYFLPASGTPERVTYYGLDWANPHPGRQQPGDAFVFPDLSGERAYIYAVGARIVPHTNVLFDQARVYTAGVYLPTPRYVVTFSPNSHFYENAFAGARADVGVPFNGSAHSLTALHLRNDAFNGTYLAFDQHFVWDKDWIAFGIDPLTQEQRQYNLIGYKRWSPKFETRLFTQVSAAQAGIINRADNAAGFTQLQVTGGFRGSSLTFTQNNYWQYLLGFPRGLTDLTVARPDYDPRWREHPMDSSLVFTGSATPIVRGRFSVSVQPRAGVGYAHDVYGYGGYPNEQPGPQTLWYHYVGGSVASSQVRLPLNLSFNASYDRQRQWYSEPHHVDTGDLRLTLAGAQQKVSLRYFLAYEVKTTDDYWGAQQLSAYPAAPDVAVTSFGTFGGQRAFRGLGTSRGYISSMIYTPTRFFELNVGLSRFYDTPAPVPGLYGQPPWQLTTDVRLRISRQVLLDVSRFYYFNFANERWQPQFGIQFSP